jgi:integrase
VGNKTAGAYFRTLLLTGMRPAECATMTVGMVNRHAGRIDLPKTKNGQEHRIYVAPELGRVLAPHLKDKEADDLVFPECGDPRKSLQAAIEVLGVAFSQYDLRKLCARVAQECSVAHPVVRKMLNHSEKSGDITGRHYAQPTESQMRNAFARVAQFATGRGLRKR